MPIRALILTRSSKSVETTPGGDVAQAVLTAAALEQLGVEVSVTGELRPQLSGWDLIHVFNVVRPQDSVAQARHARAYGLPVVLSTVYCDVWEFEQRARSGVAGFAVRHAGRDGAEALKAGGRALRSGEIHSGLLPLLWPGYRRLQKELIRDSAMLLPNSVSEIERLRSDLGVSIPDNRWMVIPNGVDIEAYALDRYPIERAPKELLQFAGCVLCVARIEGRKNQLNLVRASASHSRPLVLAGKTAANQHGYVRDVMREVDANPNIHYLGAVSEEEKRWLYRLAHVHVLPSWMETTGLSSLEAAALDCAIVITDKGDAREYFGSYADYCDPESPESIAAAIHRAAERGPSQSLRQKILAEYTWRRAAERTLEAYELVLARKSA